MGRSLTLFPARIHSPDFDNKFDISDFFHRSGSFNKRDMQFIEELFR